MSAHSSIPEPRLVFSLSVREQHAELVCTDELAQTFVLTVDDFPQSQVSLSDASALEFGYVRDIARVIDAWAPAGHPLACAHLGAGALTLARYIAATRPGSVQRALERERELLEAVLREVPLNAEVTLLFGDAREIADAPPTGAWSASSCDVTVIDLWAGATIGARVASLEFYRRVAERVSDDGFVAVNLLDGPGFEYSRGQVATLQAVFAEVAVVLEERMLDNTALGNVVVLASNRAGAFVNASEWFGTASASSLREFRAIAGDLKRFVAGASIVTDATACDSPPPDESHFNEHLGRPLFAS